MAKPIREEEHSWFSLIHCVTPCHLWLVKRHTIILLHINFDFPRETTFIPPLSLPPSEVHDFYDCTVARGFRFSMQNEIHPIFSLLRDVRLLQNNVYLYKKWCAPWQGGGGRWYGSHFAWRVEIHVQQYNHDVRSQGVPFLRTCNHMKSEFEAKIWLAIAICQRYYIQENA